MTEAAEWALERLRAHLDNEREGASVAVIVQTREAGPGTELKKLLADLGLVPASGCDCNARAAQMDREGDAWCEEHQEEIVAWLRENQQKAGWFQTVKAASLAVACGLAFRLDHVDPLRSIVLEAIGRARKKPVE